MKIAHALLAAAALSLATSFALAGTSTANFQSDTSLHNLGSFTGAVSYDNVAEKLTVTLDNTSAGKLTGFAFDIAGDSVAKFEKTTASPWKDDRNHKGIVVAKPYGNFEAGAALHGNFGAKGNGIAAGASKSFVFDLTGTHAASLTAADFLTGPGQTQLVASFAGFRHGKTDRSGGVIKTGLAGTTGDTNTTPGINPLTNPLGNDQGPLGNGCLPPKGDGNPPTVAAVPLPSAAWSGLATLAAIFGISYLRRFRAEAA